MPYTSLGGVTVTRKPTAAQQRRDKQREEAEAKARAIAALCRKNEQERPAWRFDENGKRIGINDYGD